MSRNRARKFSKMRSFLEKVDFLGNKACAYFVNRLKLKESKTTSVEMSLTAKIDSTMGEKLVRKFWDHDFSSFLTFLTKWLIFRYESNGIFYCLSPEKEPQHSFEGFMRLWFLTCSPKNMKISKKILENRFFGIVCVKFKFRGANRSHFLCSFFWA